MWRAEGGTHHSLVVEQGAGLLVVEGPQKGTHFPLAAPLTSIGREEECTIQILDDQVSRKHLQLRLDPGATTHTAGDYRSANGVIINGKQIVDDVPLADGDRIRIGNTTLMYLAEAHADAASAVAAAKKKGEWKRTTLLGR